MTCKKFEFTKQEKRERERNNKKKKGSEMGQKKKEVLDSKFKKEITIKPRTQAQSEYLEDLKEKEVIFATGPAGTGKSFVSLAYAAQMFEENEIEKIIVTRPLVESGKEVGALPGEMEDKIQPFFQAPREILEELLGESYVDYLIKNGDIEFKPLEFLRGSTFKKSFIVLDEGQNTTPGQMLLFLSRIGGGCKVCVNGDTAQSDIDQKNIDGLTDALNKLEHLDDVGIIDFEEEDIVRSRMAKQIIKAYRNS